MKISQVNNLSFQKKLLANAGYIKDGKSEECKIYALEKGIDDRYFSKFSEDSWKDGWYYNLIKDVWKYPSKTNIFIVAEDENKNCLGVSLVDGSLPDKNFLNCLEVNPECAKANKGRTSKYIGETLLAAIAKYTYESGKEMLDVPSPVSSAYDFYESKCGFRLTRHGEFAINGSQIERLVRQNEEHTGKRLEVFV